MPLVNLGAIWICAASSCCGRRPCGPVLLRPKRGPAGLRQGILKHSDMLLRSFTESLMTYGLGRRVEYYDMPTVRGIVRDAESNGNRMSSFILGVINSPAFRMTQTQSVTATTAGNQR